MNDLVFKSAKGNPVTTSLLVADKFEKEHKNVLDSIRDILAAKKKAANYFYESTYMNRGKIYPLFYMDRNGFSRLVMGFTGERALDFKLEFIEAFNRMEANIQQEMVVPRTTYAATPHLPISDLCQA